MSRGYLRDFLFRPEQLRTPARALSGGERNRLLLARLFAQPANLLVLDEPTNDLDIDTLELLQEMVADFSGTLLLVSHDRAFLDSVVTSLLVLEGDGRVQDFVGGYSDWARWRDARDAARRGLARASSQHSRGSARGTGASGGSRTRTSANSTSCPRSSKRWMSQRATLTGADRRPGFLFARPRAEVAAKLQNPCRNWKRASKPPFARWS